MKATPGPWKYSLQTLSDGVDNDLNYINPRTIKDYYCVVAGQGFWQPEDNSKGFNLTGYMSEENARLIAAAPELLEALQHVDILIGEPDDTLDYQALIGRRMLEMWPRIQAVINKAKGQ